MADEDTDELDLTLTPAQAGVGFRAEMWAMNTLLGYWKHLLAVLVVVLLAVLMYGVWGQQVTKLQRGTSSAIADIESKLPAAIPELPDRIRAGEDIPVETLIEAATSLENVAKDATGTAAVEANLKAAELFRLAGSTDDQRRVLEAASQSATGTLRYAAIAALANLDLEQDNGDEAVTRLKGLVEGGDGFLAEQAALDLALALEHLERKGEADKVYGDFLERWPDSPRAEEVRERRSRTQGEG